MAFTDKIAKDATTGATSTVAGSFVDVLMPHTVLADPLANTARCAAYAIVGWLGRGYRDNKTVGF